MLCAYRGRKCSTIEIQFDKFFVAVSNSPKLDINKKIKNKKIDALNSIVTNK